MKNNRRKFLKQFGFAGLSLTGATKLISDNKEPFQQTHRQRFNMHGYAAPALDTVRIGLIGIGARGSGTVRRLAGIEGVEIKALCDIVPARVSEAIESIQQFPQHNPDSYTHGQDAWKKLCERDDIDMIYIATPWRLHAPQAVFAMEHDKHVYMEIPAGCTIEENWQLVETSERTRKHCALMSGNCHSGLSAITLNMVRQGFFGDLIHGEGNYVHDRVSDRSRWVRDKSNNNWFGYRPWRVDENVGRHGNLYPQHGLGPLAQMMDLNYGDQMDYLVSVSSDDFTMGGLMEELAAEDDYYKPYVGQDFRGNMNVTVIRTKKGRTLMLQHDISSPRPGSRFQLISGTQGIFRHYPTPARMATSHDGWVSGEEYNALLEKYTPTMTKSFNELVRQAADEERDQLRSYARVNETDWRLIDCLRNGLPLEMDVYDAALWSSVTPLTEWSVANRSNSVSVPDFTSGAWETNERGMDIELLKGGGTTRLL
ncbi:MAG: Gfo/Idh/MocA family oxidoreductase [Balneolales bacterium]